MKIIDLDISAFLSGDTKIEEIGFVFNPAVEVDWVYFNSQKEGFDGPPECGCNIESNQQFSHSEIHARIKAEQIGCKGAHIMGNEWHPCETHDEYETALEQKQRQEDEGMIEGIIELLNQVEDIENRAKMAIDVLKDFEDEGVIYDYELFLERIGLDGVDLEYLWDDTMELEDLLEKGYVITDVKEIDPVEVMNEYKDSFNSKEITEEQFYTLTSSPNEPSIMDSSFRLRRYVYSIGVAGGPDLISTSRVFCRRMIGKRQLVWRFEDINMLSTQLNAEDSSRRIIPRPEGANVNVFLYSGGANCRHRFQELSLEPGKRIPNNKQVAKKDASIIMDAPGQAGQQNEDVQYGRKRNPAVLEVESETFSQEYTPIGFLQGVPVYDIETYAQDKSMKMGCEGVYEKVDYMGEDCFRPCRTKNSNSFTNQEYSFKLDDEKRMIYAPAMIPNKLIRRYEPGEGEYWVRFKKDAIERAAHKYLAEGRTTPEYVNYEHTDKKFDDIYLVESWIVGSDEDKIYDYGYSREEVPEGSWIVGYKVNNDELWNDYVKKGLIRAVSVEGLFDMSFNSQRTDDYLLSEVINILNQIE